MGFTEGEYDKEWIKMAEEPMEVQAIVVPRMYVKRVLLVDPTMDSVQEGLSRLMREGVPEDAAISFQQWNKPPGNVYVIATWQEKPWGHYSRGEDKDGD